MPVLVNPKTCLDREHCFAAAACPYGAFLHNSMKKTWEIDATICGDCPGPCLNFCDQYALHWGNDLIDLKLVKAEVDGTMKPAQVAAARLKHKEEAKEAQEAARVKSAESIFSLTRATFESAVLRSKLPVVVDCWADWCEPCKQFSPVFDATARQYAGVVKFAKLDTEAEPVLARGLGVTALPTVLIFYKGQIINAAEGALPTQQFQTWIYQTLAAIRQYEAQLEAESEEAITAASERVANLDKHAPEYGKSELEPAAKPSAPLPPSSLVLDPRADAGPAQRPGDDPGKGRGKQTASGLYIP
ncbi:MAG: thioredoxin fold domain-containing protein [Chloroflexi bacterium]|nr:thioredoxin fold domain-containing protein [Chloroflexota bacterium]